MGAHEPALLDGGHGARLRDDSVRILRVTDVPECGREILSMLVDGDSMVAVKYVDAQARLQIVELGTADAGDVAGREADRTDGVPYPDHLHVRGLGVFEQPPLLLSQLTCVSGRLHLPQLPNGFLVTFLVAREELGHADGRAGLQDAVDRDQPGKSSCGVRTPTEAEDEDVVAVVVILNK